MPRLPTPLFLLVLCTAPLSTSSCGGSGESSREGGAPSSVSPPPAALSEAPVPIPEPGDPEQAARHLEAAQRLIAVQRPGEAIAEFEAALAADPAHLQTRVDYGFLLLEPTTEQSLGRALEQLRIALAIQPDHVRARAGEGIARERIGDHARAEPCLRESLAAPGLAEIPELHAAVLHSLASIEHASGRREEALALFQAALELPISELFEALVRSDLASLLQESGEPEAAVAELRAVIKLDPERLRAHYQLSRLLDQLGRPRQALAAHRIHSILLELHGLQRKKSQEAAAERAQLRRQLIEIYPYPRARRLLIRELLSARRYYNAVQEIVREKDRGGSYDAELLYLMARAQAGQGDLDSASQMVRLLKEADPATPLPLLRDVLDEWQKNNPRANEATYQRVLRSWTQD